MFCLKYTGECIMWSQGRPLEDSSPAVLSQKKPAQMCTWKIRSVERSGYRRLGENCGRACRLNCWRFLQWKSWLGYPSSQILIKVRKKSSKCSCRCSSNSPFFTHEIGTQYNLLNMSIANNDYLHVNQILYCC